MTKIPPFALSNLSNEAENFRDSVTTAWNYGKYQIPIVTSVPNWAANPGECVLFTPASGGTTQYFYKGSAWISSWSVTA